MDYLQDATRGSPDLASGAASGQDFSDAVLASLNVTGAGA